MNFRLCTYEISRLIRVSICSINIISNYKLQIRELHRMSLQEKRGALVVFEGLDRSGKSTQSRLLVESLKKSGKEAELIVFPDRSTPIGKIIGSYLSNKADLNDKALHLLFTANRFENMNKIKKLLYSGVHVVVDRYSFSGIVFSSAKNGMDPEWCKIPESGLPVPDAVFFLHLPFNDMRSRPGFGHERYETVSFQSKVLQEYEHLASEFNFTKIEANDSIENIQSNILKHTLKVIDTVKNTELHYFDFIEKETESYQKENVSMNKII